MNRVVAFLPGYATDATRGLDIGTIPGDRITDLIYCFCGFQQQQDSSWVPTFPEPNDTKPGHKHNVAKLIALKTRWPALNIVISIGGWIHSHQGSTAQSHTPVWTAVSATPSSRQAFVAACIETFIQPTHPKIGPLFGGIDLDWEYPYGSTDQHNITLLLQEFRSQLDTIGQAQGRQLTLSSCWGSGAGYHELAQQASVLDWFNLMTYLAHHALSNPSGQYTDFGAPLYPSPSQPPSNATWTIDEIVTTFLSAGVPAQKLVIGINTYARTYAGVPNVNNGLYQPYSGPGPGDHDGPGILEYTDVMANYLPAYDYHFDSVTQCSYLYSPSTGNWISFESADSIAARAAYADQKGLAGLLLWELSADALSDLNQPPPPAIPALIDAMPRGISGFANKALLHESSDTAPSLAFAGGFLFLTARRPDGTERLQVAFSDDNGASFGDTYVADESSDTAPVLADLSGTPMIAWKGAGNNQLNVAQVAVGSVAQGHISIEGFLNKVTLGETSDHAPALAAYEGRLFLAWKGAGNSNLNILFSSDGGATFGDKYVSAETSDVGPALVSHNGQLMIAWKGPAKDVNVAQVALLWNNSGGFTIQGLTNKVTLFDTTDNAPVLASDGRRLFVAWTGTGAFHPQLKFSSDDGATFGGQFISAETSDVAPALASDGSQVPIAWKGRGNNSLSVAQLAFF